MRRGLHILSAGVLVMTLAHACASPPASFVGGWTASEVAGVPSAPGVTTTLVIAEDGTVSGSGGCNRYRGKAELGEGTIAFSPLAATRMACSGASAEQEQRLFAALATARRFRIEGAELLLVGEDGAVVARFSRGI
jgi:heat shock protein HslJ